LTFKNTSIIFPIICWKHSLLFRPCTAFELAWRGCFEKRSIAMKILGIDHIGVAVNSIQERHDFWTDALGLEFAGDEVVKPQKVKTAFYPFGEGEVELLESTAPDGPVAKFVEKKGEGIHHIAFRVSDIEAALDELKQKGVRLIDETPRPGAGGAKIAFLHPKATGGVLVEICERD